MLKRVRRAAAAAAVAALCAAACADAEPEPPAAARVIPEDDVDALDPALADRVPEGTTFAMAEEGRSLYAPCVPCHGPDARGTALGSSLRDAEWVAISGELASIEEVIRAGVPDPEAHPVPMPVMGGGDFTPEQLRALATYVYVLSRAEG